MHVDRNLRAYIRRKYNVREEGDGERERERERERDERNIEYEGGREGWVGLE
jgi:hypothetical protein